MSRILLLVDHKENRRLLAEWLNEWHEVLPTGPAEEVQDIPQEHFDLCIISGVTLMRLKEQVAARRNDQLASFLPFLLVVARKDVAKITPDMRQLVDELLLTPVEKLELRIRIESLLRIHQHNLHLVDALKERRKLEGELFQMIGHLEQHLIKLRQSSEELQKEIDCYKRGLQDLI